MTIYRHKPGSLEKKSEFASRMWEEGGPLRNADKARTREISDLFKSGMSIREIKEKLNYAQNCIVAKYLRKAGFKVPYSSRLSRLEAYPTIRDRDSYYANMTIQDLEA